MNINKKIIIQKKQFFIALSFVAIFLLVLIFYSFKANRFSTIQVFSKGFFVSQQNQTELDFPVLYIDVIGFADNLIDTVIEDELTYGKLSLDLAVELKRAGIKEDISNYSLSSLSVGKTYPRESLKHFDSKSSIQPQFKLQSDFSNTTFLFQKSIDDNDFLITLDFTFRNKTTLKELYGGVILYLSPKKERGQPFFLPYNLSFEDFLSNPKGYDFKNLDKEQKKPAFK